ncbi:MAG: hypothetical protein ABIH37_04725 [archaeon]
MTEKEEKEEIQYLEPEITETKIWNQRNVFIAIFIGLALVIVSTLSLIFFDLDGLEGLVLFLIVIIIYAIVLFFLLEPKHLKQIKQPILKVVSRVVKEPGETVYKQVPYEVEKRIYVTPVKETGKTVYKQVPYETEKRIYITPVVKPEKKYKFYGSNKSLTYHKGTCRLGRLIKDSYKVGKNDDKFFKKNKYKPCKVCIKGKFKNLK